jgi:type I restriction enzyme S subunit
MSGWRDCTLGDLLSVKHGYAFLGEYFADGGSHIVLTPGNFYDEGGFKRKEGKEKWYSGPIPDEYVLAEGDLIVAMTEQAEGLLGSSAIVPTGGLYLHNQRLGLIELRDKSSVDKRFVYYLFNFKPVRQQIRASASGVKIRHTAPSRIADVKVRVPCLALQRQIAQILSAYDDLIENNQRRIQILEEMARALYREWFVEFKFPGHEKVRLKKSPLGPIPEDWVVTRLDQVADVNRAQITARSAPDEINYIDIASVSPGRIDTITSYTFSDAPGRARRVVQHGDVVWSCVRPNRRSHAMVLHPRANTIASTGFAVLTAVKVPFPFLYLTTTTDEFVAFLANNATGAAYPAVTGSTFESAQLVIPHEALLRQFAGVAVPVAEQIHVLSCQSDNLRRTRDLLLPRLLSGQIVVHSTSA